jgi:hypothetical protein
LISGIATSVLVIVSFASALLQIRHEFGVAILFIVALVTFTSSLVEFAREVRIALLRNGSEHVCCWRRPGRVRRHVRSWQKPPPHSKAHPLVNRLNLAQPVPMRACGNFDRTSARRLPQAVQARPSSMSDSRTSSG